MLLEEKIITQLKDIFNAKLKNDIHLVTVIDIENPKSVELAKFLDELKLTSDKIKITKYNLNENKDFENFIGPLPCVAFDKDNKYTGVKFYGIPGGHEFNSFILAILNIDSSNIVSDEIKTNIKVFVSLACHHCPDMVTMAQKLAIENNFIEAEMIDASLFPELVEKYSIQSVPFTVVDNNPNKVLIGKKSIDELKKLF